MNVNYTQGQISQQIYLIQNTYYPILILWGQSYGGYNLYLTFTNPSNVTFTDGTGYYFNTINSFVANIYQRKTYITFDIPNKTYDATSNININYTLSNIILSDTVYLNYNYILYGINVGTYLLDIYGINTNNNNYFITISSYIQDIIIYPFNLNVSFNSLNKIYDGNNIAYVNYEFVNIYTKDIGYVDISNNYLALYDTINPGINIPINISNVNLFGLLSNNYYISSNYTINGIIYTVSIVSKEDNLIEYIIENDRTINDNTDSISNYYYYAYNNNLY
jgi:hypothetical protein